MSWKQHRYARERLCARLEREYAHNLAAAQSDLSARLGAGLAALPVTADGVPVAGRALSRAVALIFEDYYAARLRDVLPWLLRALRRLLRTNRAYFAAFELRGPDAEIEQKVLESLGYDLTSRAVIEGSWLESLLRAGELRRPVLARLRSAALGATALSTVIRSIKRLFTGAKGLLRKRFGAAASVFIQVDNSTQLLYADALGLNHALFAGTIMERTRAFCEARAGGIFTRKVIDSWNALRWAGKIIYQDVKEAVGGHNCRHHFSWMPEATAERLAAQLDRPINSYR